jgi:hypothetical protein
MIVYLPRWCNGSHAGLRSQCLIACRFESDLGHQNGYVTRNKACLRRVTQGSTPSVKSGQESDTILKHITKSPGSERGIVCFNMVRVG